MASNTITVKKICIQIDSKTIELTPDQLRELRDVLDATFPKGIGVPGYPIIIDRPVYPYPSPLRYWETLPWAGCDSGTISFNCKTQ